MTYKVLDWNTFFWNEIRSFGVKYKVLEWSSTPNFQSGWKDANPVKIINHMSAWFCVIVREVCVKYQVFAWNTKFLRDLGPLEISRISAQKVIALGVQKMSNVQIWWHVVNSSQISRNFRSFQPKLRWVSLPFRSLETWGRILHSFCKRQNLGDRRSWIWIRQHLMGLIPF